MFKKLKKIVCSTILLFLLALLSAGMANAVTHTQKELMILFTHDLHSYFLPHRIITEKGEQIRQGGYARLAHVIKKQRRFYPGKTILLDAGDFSMGTLFHTPFMTEAFELRLMEKMGYDVITFGNHDFDFHPEGLAQMMVAAHSKGKKLPRIVASNIVLSVNDSGDATLKKVFADYPVKNYTVFKSNGLRIGVFGIMGEDAAENSPFAKPVAFADPIEASRRAVEELKNKEKVDIVICLSHSGTFADKSRSEDEILARAVPQIDVIISGHTHTVLSSPMTVGRTVIVSGGRYGEYLGSLRINFDKPKGVAVVSYELKNMTSDIPEDKGIAAAISGYKKIVDRDFLARYNLRSEEIIAESNFSMDSLASIYRNPRETGLGNLIVDAYRAAIKHAEGSRYRHVHFALQPLGLIRDSFYKGKITAADIFQVLSLGIGPDRIAGYPLVSFYISGKELKDILEVHTTIAPMKKSDAYLQVSGVKFTYNPERGWFDRITSVDVEDENGVFYPLDPDKLYRACANLYTAAMIDYISSASYGLIQVQPKDASGNLLSNIESSIIYINKNQELKEWLALIHYLRTFKNKKNSNIPQLPERYSKPEGRYLSQPSLNPISLFGGGNIMTNIFLFAGLIVLLIGLAVVYVIIGKIRKSNK